MEQNNEIQQPQDEIMKSQESIAQPQNNGKGFSIASLVLGIVAVVLSFFGIVSFVGLVCGILSIVLSVLGRKKSKLATGKSSGLATAGLVLGIVGTAIAGIGVACTIASLSALSCAYQAGVIYQ